jgi:hypothetical protein
MRTVLLGVVALGVLLGLPAPAYAHGSVDITVHSDGWGLLWATVRWSDGHPVGDPVVAIVLATSDAGDRVGPAALKAAADGSLSYPGTLSPGRWHVAVDVANPGIGHCEADLRVSPGSAVPADVACGTPPPAAVRTSSYATVVGAGLAAVALGLYVITVARRRTTRKL